MLSQLVSLNCGDKIGRKRARVWCAQSCDRVPAWRGEITGNGWSEQPVVTPCYIEEICGVAIGDGPHQGVGTKVVARVKGYLLGVGNRNAHLSKSARGGAPPVVSLSVSNEDRRYTREDLGHVPDQTNYCE